MKELFFIVIIFLNSFFSSAQTWTAQEFLSANTAQDIQELTSEEKEVLLYFNLARLYPKKFAQLEVERVISEGFYSESTYTNSLLNTLRRMKPAKVISFDKSMYLLALCFANESGESGYVGHKRVHCKKGMDAECCSYGYNTGRAIVLQLLIDEFVPSLGHRIICLDKEMEKVGVNIQPHAKYDYCCVLDFKRKEINYSENNKSRTSAFFNKIIDVFD